MSTLTEDQFDERFNPQVAESGDLFEYAEVQHLPADRVWTIVEGDDGNLYATPGFHVVNRQGYVTSETPWREADGIETAVWAVFEDGTDGDGDEDDFTTLAEVQARLTQPRCTRCGHQCPPPEDEPCAKCGSSPMIAGDTLCADCDANQTDNDNEETDR